MRKWILFFLLILTIPAFSDVILPASQVKGGMKGKAWTVFNGWEAKPFDLEIIDVADGYFVGYPMILAKGLSSNVIRTGVAEGMSGSPVYIDGKLIGAVAYTWGFAKEPVFGITPIEAMINITNAVYQGSQDTSFKKVETPILFSGFSGQAAQFLKDFLKTKGFNVSESISGTAKPEKRDLKPGDGVAINMVDGDLIMAGIGTVTYTNGDGIWIFGHPMERFGHVKLPVSRAYIYTILASRQISFKMGTSSLPIGATVYDGQTAVYCKKGIAADMVPVTMSVSTPATTRNYHFRVAAVKEYFPSLTVGSLSSALENTVGTYDDKTMALTLVLKVKSKSKEFFLTNSFHYAFNPVYFDQVAMMMDLRSYFGRFLNFDWQHFDIQNVKVKVVVKPVLNYSILQDVSLRRMSYFPGEEISADVLLRSLTKGYDKKTLKIQIPRFIKPGKYVLVFGNDFALDVERTKLAPSESSLDSGEDLIRQSMLVRDSRNINMALFYPEQGWVVRGQKFRGFPSKYARLFASHSVKKNKPIFVRSVENKVQVGETVYGSRVFSIEIKKKPLRKIVQ